jgi:hypothetical protein
MLTTVARLAGKAEKAAVTTAATLKVCAWNGSAETSTEWSSRLTV